MGNPVIESLERQREEQTSFVDQLLTRVADEGRDLVEAETANLNAARERIKQIDSQLEPLRDYEALKGMAAEGSGRYRPAGGAKTESRLAAAAASGDQYYKTAGAFMVDSLKAQGVPWAGVGPDAAAAERVALAVAGQSTGDSPGVLPVPIVGEIYNAIDATRPLMTSLGVKPLGGIPGLGFTRPKVTQHVKVGPQTAELGELPSQAMKITPVEFTKKTYGGALDVSRQDIDWTSPSAWDALLRDLADVYAIESETAVSAAFAAGVTQKVDVTGAEPSVGEWMKQLYLAAVACYKGGKRLPDRIWVSLDMWGLMGAVVDQIRPLMRGQNDFLGNQQLARFAGVVLDLPRIVVPTFPVKNIVLGSAPAFEVYEERIGLLQAIKPANLGVQVAYGGYTAFGFMDALAFCKLNPKDIVFSGDEPGDGEPDPQAAEANPEADKAGNGKNGNGK